MLAKAVTELPPGDLLFEPKWDGFRCVVFRDGDEVELGSRNERPLTRYFPELIEPLRAMLPTRCVVDSEIVVATGDSLDFDALQQRIHPAESRINMLAERTPAQLIAFDLLAEGDEDLTSTPFAARRSRLEAISGGWEPPLHLTPATDDRALAADWFVRFEGAGLDGLIAKPPDGVYVPDKRVQFKWKHRRTADAVVAGYRIHKDGKGVGSLLLGLNDDDGRLHHVGVAASFTAKRRGELLDELAPYTEHALDGHPWREWADAAAHSEGRMPGGLSRWNNQKDLSWQPVRPELVVEVNYESVLNGRFRATTRFVRWRPDKAPSQCRYDQLDQPEPLPLSAVFGAGG